MTVRGARVADSMTLPGITTIGLIGAGRIGSQLARLSVAHGYRVVISNSRGPETLTDLVDELGSSASAASAADAAAAGDLVIVTIPAKAIDRVPVEPLVGKIVIDTNNYYPSRDGRIAAIDDDSTTVSELLQARLPESHVVKLFNAIRSDQLTSDATPTGTPGRRALALFGDSPDARATVAALTDEFGFDTVDGGPLREGWRVQSGTPAYGARETIDELQADLAAADRTTIGM
jgi:8-hydroxy-5-deazaflavin:NADPH oxidoreductase